MTDQHTNPADDKPCANPERFGAWSTNCRWCGHQLSDHARAHTLDEIRDVWLANRDADGTNWEQALGAVYDLASVVARERLATVEAELVAARERKQSALDRNERLEALYGETLGNCGEAERQVKAANELLRELEWGAAVHRRGSGWSACCPFCFSPKERGHANYCKLAHHLAGTADNRAAIEQLPPPFPGTIVDKWHDGGLGNHYIRDDQGRLWSCANGFGAPATTWEEDTDG